MCVFASKRLYRRMQHVHGVPREKNLTFPTHQDQSSLSHKQKPGDSGLISCGTVRPSLLGPVDQRCTISCGTVRPSPLGPVDQRQTISCRTARPSLLGSVDQRWTIFCGTVRPSLQGPVDQWRTISCGTVRPSLLGPVDQRWTVSCGTVQFTRTSEPAVDRLLLDSQDQWTSGGPSTCRTVRPTRTSGPAMDHQMQGSQTHQDQKPAAWSTGTSWRRSPWAV